MNQLFEEYNRISLVTENKKKIVIDHIQSENLKSLNSLNQYYKLQDQVGYVSKYIAIIFVCLIIIASVIIDFHNIK